ncbi:uncharacterized protein [Diadema setosum]|uniref:uncharacterized protein n=1 Tax=Diadema antillarum TaxID=105358 RepID=UPI003A883642
MATFPTGTCMAVRHCRQLQSQQRVLLTKDSTLSPVCSPESTPPASPRKDGPLGLNPLAKINKLLTRSISSDAEVGASASGLTQSLEASHHTSSITSMT